MLCRRSRAIAWAAVALTALPCSVLAAPPEVDLSGYRPECGIRIERERNLLLCSWDWSEGQRKETGTVEVDLRPGRPLIHRMGAAESGPAGAATTTTTLENADPVTFLLVGSREAPSGRPPGMSAFNVFFDAPAKRPFQKYLAKLNLKRVRVASQGRRATVSIGDVTAGSFSGELRLTFYDGAGLVHLETVLHTDEDRRAILYDTGLVLADSRKVRLSWFDTEGKFQHQEANPTGPDQAMKVAHRVLGVERGPGSVACFPPPHQFYSPRDLTDNLSTVWYGKGHRDLEPRTGFGIRQSETGGGSFVPWFNAPPGTEQHLGVFYLLSSRGADEALKAALKYTHGDRFPDLAGYRKFTTHWHMAITMAALEAKKKGQAATVPDFVRMFKAMGVDIVHLAEFHGDGHPQDPGPVRLAEMKAMFDECRRVSDDNLLVLPGEEANVALGNTEAGKRPGHWVYLFPHPVYWTMKRAPGQPFEETISPYGKVYHVGDGADWQRLLNQEHGLAWTSHPRIKGSSWTPDLFRREDFYASDRWLGAAWKAMPADLSLDRLGKRALDLLDDMANWGPRKVMPGEVDVFKVDHTHELYGHMNVNYVRFAGDRLPRFDDGWQPLLDSLRAGTFFVTTGEILIPGFTVEGKPSGSTASLPASGRAAIQLELEWTFPLRFVEVISGDGERVYRERIDLADTGPFGRRSFQFDPELAGRKWVRVEAWDIAANGAFTQPVWLGGPPSPSR